MVYIVTLAADEMDSIRGKLRIEQRLTKALPKGIGAVDPVLGPPMVFVLRNELRNRGGDRSRRLAWLGVVAQHNTVGAVDRSITIDPLRECMDTVPLDGDGGLLHDVPHQVRKHFDEATKEGDVGECGKTVWEALEAALRRRHPSLDGLLDWLLAQADPPVFDSSDPADRSWQEQRDATRTVLRLADFPLSALAAWRRPASPHAPYLAGLIPHPVEHSSIDHDVRVSAEAFGMLSEWMTAEETRCDIHILRGADGRRLEVVNVNATRVETRLGTDMVYYHEPTQSFVFVQYKRLDPKKRWLYVDKRLRDQLDRLDKVAQLSRSPARPSEWRLGNDACFLKLAYWPNDAETRIDKLAPGMYLPVSYVRLLLEDDCTLGVRTVKEKHEDTRRLGYPQVPRHLVNTQFVELVKHGLAGTVGTTLEQLIDIVNGRIELGQAVVMAREYGQETEKERQNRNHSRGSKTSTYTHIAHGS